MTNKKINAILKPYLQPAFLICVGVLAAAGLGMSVTIQTFEIYLQKEPLPIKKSLEKMDESKLGPYEIVKKIKIENEEIVKSLGTEEYIQWIFRDTDPIEGNPLTSGMLFVTYYKKPDRVPHVPEECYTGGGYQRVKTENIEFSLEMPDGIRQIPGRYLVFGSQSTWSGMHTFPVLYLFRVNGVYAGSREQARLTLNKNVFGKYSYFCKIEIVFNQQSENPTKQHAIQASEKLLGVVLPELESEHWPDERFEQEKKLDKK
jgi:hypothetical protein